MFYTSILLQLKDLILFVNYPNMFYAFRAPFWGNYLSL